MFYLSMSALWLVWGVYLSTTDEGHIALLVCIAISTGSLILEKLQFIIDLILDRG